MKLDEEQRTWLENVRREWLHRLKPASTPLGRHVFDVGTKKFQAEPLAMRACSLRA